MIINRKNVGTGTITITSNGTYDVSTKGSAVVNIASGNDGVVVPKNISIKFTGMEDG